MMSQRRLAGAENNTGRVAQRGQQQGGVGKVGNHARRKRPIVQRLAALMSGVTERQIFAMLTQVRETQRRLQANVNLRLQLEGFFIRILDCRKA